MSTQMGGPFRKEDGEGKALILHLNLRNVLPLAFIFVQVGIFYGNYLLKGEGGEGRGGEVYAWGRCMSLTYMLSQVALPVGCYPLNPDPWTRLNQDQQTENNKQSNSEMLKKTS